MSGSTDLIQELQKSLSTELWQLIKLAGETGAAEGHPLYLVGGRVRDLLLERESGDLDLAVEGDALAVARGMAEATGGQVKTHEKFGTATYTNDDISIDLATTRSEEYSRPGTLPLVRPGSIDTDMARRDFTINAMALRLSPPNSGDLLDPHNGEGDLSSGLIRILHDGSFIDDPTRILRAIRYEQRLGFQLESETERLLRRDLPSVGSVGVDRNRHELELIFQEEHPELALIRADKLGVLKQLDEALTADEWLAERYRRAREANERPSIGVYLTLLLYRCTGEVAQRFMNGYRFTKEQIESVADVMALKSRYTHLEAPEIRNSELVDLLSGISEDALDAFRAATDPKSVVERIELYVSELRHVSTCLNGRDLQDLGVPRGPELGKVLKELRRARLDGEVATREDEVAFVRALVD